MLPFSLEFLLVHPLAFLVVFLKIERHLVGSHPRGVRLWIERQNLSEIEESQNRAGGVRGMKRKGADSQIDAKLDAMGLGSLISAPELTAPPQLPIDSLQHFSAALRLLRSRRLCDSVSLLPWQGSYFGSVEPLHFRR